MTTLMYLRRPHLLPSTAPQALAAGHMRSLHPAYCHSSCLFGPYHRQQPP